ncbi:chromosome partitioning protein ParA [Limosilactobacillus reuteri]|uniref:chromosome partitioning protein ParA n=1 Tax=Limosilactobacillus reuteri TaxID=1598 RepID=UPI003D05E668
MKTSKGVILSQASQIKSDYSFALIKATADNKSLVQDASSAELKVNALVEYSKDSQWDPKKLTSLGFPAGCFLIVDLRGQDIHAADLITNLALVRQYGYQAGVIDDLSTLDDIKALKANQIYLINSGKTNDDQDASLNGNEITDGSGKLAVGMSVKWQRDYTNVDVSGDHAGFVGMGQDTLLKGGNAFGYSTNGRDFNAVITPKGLIFRRPDAERMWRLLKPNEIADINSTVGDKVKKEVDSATAEIPAAVSAANSAVSAAESAIAASKVNSDAIVAQSSAVVEAKSAMDSATAEIQQLKANAASDVAQIRADVAQVQNEVDAAKAANSASVEALKSDINTAKQDLADVHDSLDKAQAAAEQNQKLINDSVAKINSDIAQSRQDIITAQQDNDDLAKQLNTYSKEAQEQGKTIKTIQDNQDGFSITIADVKGDVTKVSDTVDGLSAGLKDAQGNIASVKAQADQLNATLTDHSKDIAQLTATAKELSSTLEDADGRLSKIEQTASEQSTTLSDLQGNLTQVKQTADNLVTTLKDAQGNIDQIKQDAKGTLEQLSNAQGDITALQKDVSGIKLTIADHDKNIHTLQADSKTLKDDMADAKGNISSLQKTSTSLVSEFKDHDGRLSKVEQTATEHTSELADTKGNLDKVTQKANALQLLLSDAQKNIQNIQLDAKGLHDTLTGQNNQLANLNVTLNNLDSKYSGITGDLQSKQTALSTEQQQTKDMLLRKADKSEVDSVKGTVNQVSAEQKVMADQINQKVSSVEYQTLKDKVNNLQVGGDNLISDGDASAFNATPWGDTNFGKHEFYYNGTKNMFLIATSAKTELTSGSNWFPVKAGQQYTLSFKGFMSWNVSSYDVWFLGRKAGTNGAWTNSFPIISGQRLSNSHCETITKTFTAPSDWNNFEAYLRFDNNGSTDGQISLFFFNEISLKEGNVNTGYSASPNDVITLIKKNVTAIDQNNKAIKLKADQTEVNNVKNTSQQLSSRLDIMADQIKSKVTSTDVNNILDSKGYATTSTVQSLVDQKAGTLSESITNLDAKYSAKDGVNLQRGTGDCSFSVAPNNATVTIENYDDHTKMFHVKGPGGFYTSYNADTSLVPTVGETYTVSADVKGSGTTSGVLFKYEGADSCSLGTVTLTDTWQRISNTVHIGSVMGQWIFYRINNAGDFYVKHIKIERGSVATPWTPAPSDNATVTQIQSITASIDGLQSNVTNLKNDTSSRITQLSNTFQSKIGDAQIAINDLKDKTLWKITDSVDLNNVVTQQKIFVKGGSNLPPGDYWWYVQVESGYDSRIVQYAVSDRDNIHYSRQYDGSKWSAWSQGATESEITQLRDDINLRVKSGDLLSQINLTAGNTLIQSNKLYLDASSVVFSGRAFIPSAAIASLSADKVNTGWLNTNNVSLGDGRTRIRADHDYMYIQPTGSAASNTGIRMGYSGLDFLTNVIPNGYNSSVPYYSIGYDGAANGYFKISAFDHINPGGATATQNWFSMVDAISLTNSEINFAAKGNMHMQVVDGGVNVRPTLLFQNNTNNGTWAGFTRGDNSDVVEFSTGDNNGENFRIDCGARFMQYVYINGNARAQQWLTNSTLSKKTNIRKLDQQIALDKIRQDDQYLYEYKRNIEQGIYDPQASFIIDDVNDVSHYSVPREFIDQSGNYREPNVELAYLIAAFQAIDKQVQKQKEEIKELKEKLQHE